MGKICWKLFTSMLVLSGLTFGGGFVIIPLMQRRFADELGWLTQEEILDMTAFARASPGAVTVNVAVQVGARMAGAAGALCGVLGTILPPLAILSALSLCYEAFSASPVIAALLYGLRLAVAVVVADASATMAMEILRGGDRLRRAVMGAVLLLSLTTGIGTIWLLAGGALLGWLLAGRGAS
ncbi:chromate transporter [Oscillospiraceae bacterium 50-60]